MKRFWKEVAVAQAAGGWQVMLDGRPLKTQGGTQQVVPNAALAELLADEWRALRPSMKQRLERLGFAL